MKYSSLLLLVLIAPAATQEKKPAKKPAPVIKVVMPLGAAPGKTTKLTVRGLFLDNAKDLRVSDGKVKILTKGKAGVPDKNPEKVGDTEIQAEITLPAEVKQPLTVTAVTPDGETKPHILLVETKLPLVAEKEPNGGFRQAQPIKLPVMIEGVINQPKDVDVFRFEGQAGQKVIFEILAARHGSPLDAMLTVYDSTGLQIAAHDLANPDPRLEVTLPAAGTFYLSLVDAHDAGSPVHVYRLAAHSN